MCVKTNTIGPLSVSVDGQFSQRQRFEWHVCIHGQKIVGRMLLHFHKAFYTFHSIPTFSLRSSKVSLLNLSGTTPKLFKYRIEELIEQMSISTCTYAFLEFFQEEEDYLSDKFDSVSNNGAQNASPYVREVTELEITSFRSGNGNADQSSRLIDIFKNIICKTCSTLNIQLIKKIGTLQHTWRLLDKKRMSMPSGLY